MEQEQKRIRMSANHPPLVAQILEAEEDTGSHIFYAPWSHYRYCCRVPELVGRCIRGCFHGWVILSDLPLHVEWSLWNPLTSMLIRLPRLDSESESDVIGHCCLSSPPYNPGSILLLTRDKKRNIVFCKLDQRTKRLRWTEISYAQQLKSIAGDDSNSILLHPICCNGKIYAGIYPDHPSFDHPLIGLIHVDIVVKEEGDVISLSLLPILCFPIICCCRVAETAHVSFYLKAYRQQVFLIYVCYAKATKLVDVFLYKADLSYMVWYEVDDLEDDSMFLVDEAEYDFSINCSSAISCTESGGGGYVHILEKTGKAIYSFHVKDKIIYESSLDLPPRSGAFRTSHISAWGMPVPVPMPMPMPIPMPVSMPVRVRVPMPVPVPEFRSQGDDGDKAKPDLLNIIPIHVLEVIVEHCVGVDYLNFRATCRRCRLAAPVKNGEEARKRLQTYSTLSPWLMVFDQDGGIRFTDPMFGGTYFRKPSGLFDDCTILCSKYGWLLLFLGCGRMAFFNPFTGGFCELPRVFRLDSCCFSAPPTSPDCLVVGFKALDNLLFLKALFVAREPAAWISRCWQLSGPDMRFPGSPTFCGPRDVYALFNKGDVGVLRQVGDNVNINFSWLKVIKGAPTFSRCSESEYFQSKCDEHGLLVVIVGAFGEAVEVWKLTDEIKRWEKIEDLGRHMIYICGTTCVCMDAKTSEMANKIYFSRLHSDNGKIVFYSLETHAYHTFDARNVGTSFKGLFGTKQLVYSHTWIQPNWC